MNQQQFQAEVMDELAQQEAEYEIEQRRLMDALDAKQAMREVREQESKK